MDILGHKEYTSPYRYSRTKVGCDENNLHLILLSKYKNFLDWQPKSKNSLKFEVVGQQDGIKLKRGEVQFVYQNGPCNRISEMNLCCSNIEATKTFLMNSLGMKVLPTSEPHQYTLGYNESFKIILQSRSSDTRFSFFIDGLKEEIYDPDGNLYSPVYEEDEWMPYIVWIQRSWVTRSRLLACFILFLFLYLIDDHKEMWKRRLDLLRKKLEVD